MKTHTSLRGALMAVVVPTVLGSACYLGNSDGTDGGVNPDGGNPVLPFQADSPFVYVAKVKNILTGLAPTQVEVDSVVNAPDDASKRAALVTLIQAWENLPAQSTTPGALTPYQQTMLTFFELAFQQTQISQVDFADIVPNGNGGIGTSNDANLLVQNARESFARTMIQNVADGKALNTAFTTNTFMMTPALAELYAFMDWNVSDDNEKVTDKFAAQTTIKANGITVESGTPISYSETINAANPNGNYMHWYMPDLTTVQMGATDPKPDCQAATRTWVSSNNANVPSAHLVHFLLYGGFEAYKINGGPPPNNNCNAYQGGTTNADAIIGNAANGGGNDFTDWKMVTILPPDGSHPLTPFWDMNALRSATTLYLNTPRVGFFSTPAFHANWQTNTSNIMRVTVNQSFIVALGAQVDGTDITDIQANGATPPGVDPKHSPLTGSDTACYGCHQYLDPSRSILQANYSYAYGQQTDNTLTPITGWFAFQGTVDKKISSLADFGNDLANHHLFPDAWVQKLCYFVNSQACDLNDPEYQAIRDHFKSDGFNFKLLVEDLLSSPLTTNAVPTLTTQVTEGELVSVSRRDHLCTTLNARLGLIDSCGLDIITTKTLTGIPEIASGLPSDGYGRGSPIPVLPSQPTLFYRAGLENICEDVAQMVIDAKTPPMGVKVYTSTSQANIDSAIADFVANIMAIVPDDPRSSVMTTKLTAHYQNAITQKATVSDALKSTFVVACLSPNVAGIGM